MKRCFPENLMLVNAPEGLFPSRRISNWCRILIGPICHIFANFIPGSFLGYGSLKVVIYFISILAYLADIMNFSPVFIILLKSRFLWTAISLHRQKHCIYHNRNHNIIGNFVIFFSLSLSFLIQVPLGSISELPAHSCQEIKASEGKDTISSKYWLDPTANRTAIFVYCDMDLEGY